MPDIVSIEDDRDLQDLLKFSLKNFGYHVTAFESAEAFFAADAPLPDLILLDIMLPGMDGSEALRRLKRQPHTKEIPVIMLTAKSTEFQIAKGLDDGADDYIVKPFSVIELSARIKANLRKRSRPQTIESAGIRLDLSAREAFLEGREIRLTLKEFELLTILLRSPSTVQTRESLLESVWGIDFLGETRTLDMHIMTLRGKLGKYSKRIATVRGIGYKYSL